ncbi:MAG: transketolase [Eubacteriales bacterium]|nr:transketolase [Eubacteriales bacterium]
MNTLDTQCVNAVRILSVDAVQKANSGHPGICLGAAPIGYELWAHHMNHNPEHSDWINRDRFILSAGHGSAMLYSLLHLFGYGLTREDMMQFRQLGSLTPGHPEYGHTTGVEATTGPLGAGTAMAVGMAMAEAHMAAVFNKDGYPVIDHYTFVLGGDGCMQEGINYEAFSHAGTLGLSKLIVLYDCNNITIEGSTDLAFTEDVSARMAAFGFQVLEVADGNDLDALGKAIEEAKADKTRPSFIKIHTHIGYASAKQDSASSHGEPLGEENIKALRENLGWASQEAFAVPDEVYAHCKEATDAGRAAEEKWNAMFAEYAAKYPELKALWDQYFDENAAEKLWNDEKLWEVPDKAVATRAVSGDVIGKVKDLLPNLIGGSADLAPSNKTYMKDEGDFDKDNYGGRNLHYGIRELCMTAELNGILLHGGLKGFCSTFFVFSDYMKPMIRLAALMKLPAIYVLTHDSIGVGEDGPTHEPIEQAAMLRATPGVHLFRPADYTETAAAWYAALTSKEHPTALALSRQNLPQLAGSCREGALKGAYIIADSKKETPDAILMASGSEVSLCLEAKEALAAEGVDVRVVSVPCMDLFEYQDAEYKEKVLPKAVRKRVAVEALSDFGWGKYVGLDGAYVTMHGFGASAPAAKLFDKFGFTVEKVAETVKSVL